MELTTEKQKGRTPAWRDPFETTEMRLVGGGGSEELQFFMSQHRKNSARGKVTDKK